MMTYKYFLSLGSNIEPCLLFLNKACVSLNSIGNILQKSSIYKTQAWGEKNQPDFLNAVIEFCTDLAPNDLLKNIKRIENSIGRTSSVRWGPREIDIDILFSDNIIINKQILKIPHVHFKNRNFVLVPMAELNGDYRPEKNGMSIKYFLNNKTDQSLVRQTNINWLI